MISRTAYCAFVLFLAFSGVVNAAVPVVNEIVLTNQHESYVVPDGRIWKIDGLHPYKSERGIGTADVYIEGQVYIGEDKDYSLYGTFDLLISRLQKFPVWLVAGTKIGVGDSRGQIVVKEYTDK